MTTSEAVWWSHSTAAFLTFGCWALVVTCSLSLKFFDQGLWTPKLFSATVFSLKGHTLSLSSSHYASFSGHVCSTPSPSIRKRSPGSCHMHKGYVSMYASTVIISQRTVVARLIQRWPFPDIPLLSHTMTPLFFSVLLLILPTITMKSLAEEHLACFHSSEGCGSGAFSPLQVPCVLQIWNIVTMYDSFEMLGWISCFCSRGLFLTAILSGGSENNWVECNILQKRLAFAICLRGNASISLWDISVALKHQCNSPVSGCLFSKVEPSLPKQISTWIMGLAPA